MVKTPVTSMTEKKLNEFDYSIFDGITGAMAGIEAYKKFYEQFHNAWDEAQKELSLHKFYHTLEVAKLMVELAPTEELKAIYFWTGMLHDFGRYYDICGGSFAGTKINHAEVGAEVLFKYRMIKLFPVSEEMYDSIESAVRFHGVLSLEEAVETAGLQLTEEQWQLCRDIRTADKWDIFKFLIWLPTEVTCGASEEYIAQMTVSERTMNELLNHKPIDRGAEEYTNIRWFMSHVGFIYDKNDQRLMNWLHETGWVAKYLAKLYECNPKDIESLKEIQRTAEKYLEDVYVR